MIWLCWIQPVLGQLPENCFDIFFDTLNDCDKHFVKTYKSNRTFCFADGVEVKAIKSVKFSVTIGDVKDVRVYIEADIVKNDLPLLLSHKSMKTTRMLLDFKDDRCQILGRYIKLQSMTSGHYSLPLINMLLEFERPVKGLKKYLRVEKRKKAEKLHRKFAHASKEKLISLVRSNKAFNDKEFLDLTQDVWDSCSVSLRFRKPPL